MKNIVREPDLSQAFQMGWQLYKENFGLILGASLVAVFVGMVTCGICMGPMICGLLGILLALLRNRDPKPQFDELFKEGFARFAPSFVSLLVLGLINCVANLIVAFIPILGVLASTALSFTANAMVSWAMLMVIDQNATIGEAISTPFQLLGNKCFWPFVVVTGLAGIVAGSGVLLCCVGVLFTMPFAYCVIVAGYEQAIGGGTNVSTSFPPPPPSTPPPPETFS